MAHRVIAKPDSATWDPEGIEATASLKLDNLFMTCSYASGSIIDLAQLNSLDALDRSPAGAVFANNRHGESVLRRQRLSVFECGNHVVAVSSREI
jgi:hypothetical protein